MRINLWYIVGGLAALFIIIFLVKNQGRNTYLDESTNQVVTSKVSDESTGETTMTDSKGPAMTIDENKTYTATLKTEKGDIVVELTAKKTPVTVNNFVTLARKGFYDNTVFHRVIKGFMIQGGDPDGNGTGGPGYKFDNEPFDGDYTRGTVAMANSGPDTNGSQFFIMHQDYALPKNYIIFGTVVEGLDVVDKIAESSVEASPMGEMSKPTQPITLQSVEITEE